MNTQKLLDLIKTGEGLSLEFKEGFNPPALGREICAFANSSGGKIILGVKDNGDIKGFKINNSQKSQIQQIARNMDPSFEISIEEVENLVIVNVLEGKRKPYSINGKFYLRVGANSQQLRRDELREFFKEERLISFDDKLNKDFDFENDFDETRFKEFLDLAKITYNSDKKTILENMNLMKDNYLTNAGVLLFSKDVKKYFIQAEVMCVLFEGTSRVNIIDQKRFNGGLIYNFEGAFNFIRSKLNTKYIIEEKRTEILELPKDAIREALMNAIVHRDYFSSGHVQVNIFLDRVEISSPGGLVKGLEEEDLGEVSLPRNKLLFGAIARTPNVEEAGTGINRIKDAMKEYGLGVEFKSTGFFTTTLYREKINEPGKNQAKTRQKPGKNERLKLILEKIEKDPYGFSQRVFAEEIGVNKSTIEEDLKELKDNKRIDFVGPSKGGHWEIIN